MTELITIMTICSGSNPGCGSRPGGFANHLPLGGPVARGTENVAHPRQAASSWPWKSRGIQAGKGFSDVALRGLAANQPGGKAGRSLISRYAGLGLDHEPDAEHGMLRILDGQSAWRPGKAEESQRRLTFHLLRCTARIPSAMFSQGGISRIIVLTCRYITIYLSVRGSQ